MATAKKAAATKKAPAKKATTRRTQAAKPTPKPTPKDVLRVFRRGTTILVLSGEHSGRHNFSQGEVCPKWAEEFITNPKCFTDETVENTPEGVEDAEAKQAESTITTTDDLDDMAIPALMEVANEMGVELDEKDVSSKETLLEKIREARG